MSASQAKPVAAVYADYISNTDGAKMPATLRHEGQRAMLNFIGTMLGGRRDPAVPQALDVLRMFSGKPEATVVGQRDRFDALSAAFINAMTGNVHEFCDTHQPTVIHPTAPVLPPILAMIDRIGCSGADAITAFVLGVDIACRIGNAVSPGHYARGWHITATCGVFGAAAASARLMKLTPEQTAHALGVAASAASGNVENLPTGAKNLGVGNSARNGLFAAFLAEKGYTGAPRSIEGPLGFARAAGDEPKMDELIGELGSRNELMRNTYKPYPCGVVLNAVIDACLAMRGEGLTADQVDAVTVSGNALLLARADRPNVANDRDTKVSIHHSVAISLLHGKAGVAEYSEPFISDPAIKALRQRVKAELDATAPPLTARVHVTTKDGRTIEKTVLAPRGSLENPMTDGDIEAKVRSLATFGGSGCDADRIIEAVWALDRMPDARALTRLLAAPSA